MFCVFLCVCFGFFFPLKYWNVHVFGMEKNPQKESQPLAIYHVGWKDSSKEQAFGELCTNKTPSVMMECGFINLSCIYHK